MKTYILLCIIHHLFASSFLPLEASIVHRPYHPTRSVSPSFDTFEVQLLLQITTLAHLRLTLSSPRSLVGPPPMKRSIPQFFHFQKPKYLSGIPSRDQLNSYDTSSIDPRPNNQ